MVLIKDITGGIYDGFIWDTSDNTFFLPNDGVYANLTLIFNYA